MSNRTLQKYIDKYQIHFEGVIHLGAYNAEELPLYLKHGAAYVIWVEANPEKWPGLQAGLCNHANQHLVKAAITDKDDQEITFNICNNKEASSIYDIGDDLALWYPEHRMVDQVLVPTITVDTMMKREGKAPDTCNFLNMDIQGAEHLALAGATSLLTSPSLQYIYTEVVWADFYEKGSALKHQIDQTLEQYGFVLVEIELDVHKAALAEVQHKIDAGLYPPVKQADCLYIKCEKSI